MSSAIHIVRAQQFSLNDRLKERLANPLDSFDILPEFKRFMKTREPYNNYIHSLPCRPRSFSPGTTSTSTKNEHATEWGQQSTKQQHYCSSGFPQHSPLTNAFFQAAKENHNRRNNENNLNYNSSNGSVGALKHKKKPILWRTPSPQSHPSSPVIPHAYLSNMHLLKSSEMIEKSSPFLLQIKTIQLRHEKELPTRRMINTAPERNNRMNISADDSEEEEEEHHKHNHPPYEDIETCEHYDNNNNNTSTDGLEQLDQSAIVFVKTRNRFRPRNICQTATTTTRCNDGQQQQQQYPSRNAVFVPPMRIFRIQSSAENTQQQQQQQQQQQPQRATTANNKSIRILKKNNSIEKPHTNNNNNNSIKKHNQDTNPGSSSSARSLSKGTLQQQQQQQQQHSSSSSRPVSPKIQQSLQILSHTDRIFVRGVKLQQNQAGD